MAVSPPSNRRTDLDCLRVLLFGGLIAYHVGLLYSSWSPFALKSEHRGEWVEMLLLTTHPWRMSLLFLISGVATRFATDKLGASRLFVSRSAQLLPPLLFGVALVVPIQTYLSSVENLGYQKSFWAFVPELFSGGHTVMAGAHRVALPVYAHLWFVAYLWIYVAALALALRFAPRWIAAAQARLETLMSHAGLLIWPLALLLALRLTLFPVFGTTLGLVDDWYNHAVSLGMFLFGFLIARNERIWDRFVALRWPALILAAAGWAAYAAFVWAGRGAPEVVERANPLMHLFYPVERWGAIVAVLGFARRGLSGDSKMLRYLNGGMFTYYIVHQPAMLLVLHHVKPLALHPALELSAVVVGTVAACGLGYELARGLGGFGVVLGVRPGRPAPAWLQAARGAAVSLVRDRSAPAQARVQSTG